MNTDRQKSNIFMYLHLYTDQNANILQRFVWTQITQWKKTFVAAQVKGVLAGEGREGF